MMTEELKKQIRPFDLAVLCGKARQSPRTKFVHGGESSPDTISTYENFCYAHALFRQKTSESVQEGKEILRRLLPFQTAEGNFPSFIHEFPKCWDFHLSLKIAPILIYLLRDFGFLLGEEERRCLERLLQHAKAVRSEKKYSLLWENRFLACHNEPLLSISTEHFSSSEWTEWLITAQLAGVTEFQIPYHNGLQTLIGPTSGDIQERGEPKPSPVEWLLADGLYSPRLLKDHPDQLFTASLYPVRKSDRDEMPYSSTCDSNFRLLWNGATLHSFVAFHVKTESPSELVYQLKEEVEFGRSDLVEVALFTDYSPETRIFVEGKKATCFALGQTVSIRTPQMVVDLQFEVSEGSGDFCGQISRGNRPTQIACKGPHQYEAFDWQIGLRTLRRSNKCRIRASLKICYLPPSP